MRVAEERLLPAGADVARYRVESLLAIGGMSEVYAAFDTVLRRRVALKVLRAGERVDRFVREAEAASSIAHPSIVSVFDSGAAVVDGEAVRFLAMEFVEGDTLARWARATRDPRRKLVVMASVAEGLARAHARGIVHRDLKPDNIMITRAGQPKILDFGIARLLESAPVREGDTAPDALLGTAAYMSPEQAERQPVDHRSDVFSFGVVLCEVMSGRSPFRRDSTVSTLHAVVHDLAPLDAFTPALQRVLRRCLAKSPDERYDSMHDVAMDLREIAGASPGTASRRSLRPALVVLLGAAVVLTLLAVSWRKSLEVVRSAVAAVTVPSSPTMQRVTSNGQTFVGAISPDGRFVAYATNDGLMQTLWIRQLATDTSAKLVGPEKSYYTSLAFSPDGEYVYYCRSTAADANTYDILRVPAIGGEPQKIAADTEDSFALSPDHQYVAFRRFNALVRDNVVVLARIGANEERELLRRHFPARVDSVTWFPGGTEVSFRYWSGNPDERPHLMAADIRTGAMRAVDVGQWRRIPDVRGVSSFVWLPDGSGAIASVAAERQPPQVYWAPSGGTPRRITSDVCAYQNVSITADGRTVLAARQDGTANIWLAHEGDRRAVPLTTGNANRNGLGGVTWSRDEVFFTMQGNDRPLLGAVTIDGRVRTYDDKVVRWQPRLSPDGRRIAFVSDFNGSVEVFVCDVDGSNVRQVTHGGRTATPQWFPDGRSILFTSNSHGQTLWRVDVESGATSQVTTVPTAAPALSPDGRHILCRLRSVDNSHPLWRTALVTAEGKLVRDLPFPRFGSGPVLGWQRSDRLAYVDYEDGAANLWTADLDGTDARQVTHFDTGRIYSFAASPDGSAFAISRAEELADLVLIRGFR